MPTKDQIKEMFRESFERADKDGTGKLTREEVGLMMGTADVQPDPKDIDVSNSTKILTKILQMIIEHCCKFDHFIVLIANSTILCHEQLICIINS